MNKLGPYWKTVVAVLGGIAMVIAGESEVDTWASIVVAAATAAGVYQVRNGDAA